MDQLIGAGGGAGDFITDADTESFAGAVIEQSMQTPVIVDFWAPWCGPCKTLGPALEKAVRAARGKVRLVKVDIDKNQALAAQMRVQSIPAVYAFHQGRPVDGFVGAVPESQLKAFVDKLLKAAAGPQDAIDEALDQARTAAAEGNHPLAGQIYSQILQHDGSIVAAIAGLARALVEQGHLAEARQVLDGAPAEAAGDPDLQSVRTSLDLAEESGGSDGDVADLEARLARDADDHEARFELAKAAFAAQDREGAVDHLLHIVGRDPEWNERAARTELLRYFEAFGPADPLTVRARRRLSSLLFS